MKHCKQNCRYDKSVCLVLEPEPEQLRNRSPPSNTLGYHIRYPVWYPIHCPPWPDIPLSDVFLSGYSVNGRIFNRRFIIQAGPSIDYFMCPSLLPTVRCKYTFTYSTNLESLLPLSLGKFLTHAEAKISVQCLSLFLSLELLTSVIYWGIRLQALFG